MITLDNLQVGNTGVLITLRGDDRKLYLDFVCDKFTSTYELPKRKDTPASHFSLRDNGSGIADSGAYYISLCIEEAFHKRTNFCPYAAECSFVWDDGVLKSATVVDWTNKEATAYVRFDADSQDWKHIPIEEIPEHKLRKVKKAHISADLMSDTAVRLILQNNSDTSILEHLTEETVRNMYRTCFNTIVYRDSASMLNAMRKHMKL